MGDPWRDAGSAEGEEAGCGRKSKAGHERTLWVAVRGSEKAQSVLAAAAAEDPLCLLLEVGVARLLVQEAGWRTGALEVTGLGREAGGQSVLAEVEGLEQRSPAQEAEALVCQMEVAEARQLECNGTKHAQQFN